MLENFPSKFNNTKKITLFLMTEKGFHFLKNLYFQYSSIIHEVVTASDLNLINDFHDDIINFCKENNIKCTMRDRHEHINSEFCIAVSWRWIINHPINGLIILHDSLLPKYRGFSPLVSALINGEKEIGVTAIFGDRHYDTGPIITQSRCNIAYPIKIEEAISLVNDVYLEVGTFIFNSILLGEALPSIPQNEYQASYSVWLNEDDYLIDWHKSSGEIERFINAVGKPYAGALTRLKSGEIVRIISAQSLNDVHIENRDPGKVLFLDLGIPIVICGCGLLKVIEATIDISGKSTSLIPLKKFRTKFY